jgi:hypothetical protein
LWSKHLDRQFPGDRKSSCGARMKPIGLCLKNIKYNPFTNRSSGELMIVHLCLACNKISCNRIAGDDDPTVLICLLDESSKISRKTANSLINTKLLTRDDEENILTILYGYRV